MNTTKFRWSRVYESTEEELVDLLQSMHVTADRRTLSEMEQLTDQIFEHDTTLYCAEGSFTVELYGKPISLQAGDGVKIPAGLSVNLIAGFSGCVYYQASVQ